MFFFFLSFWGFYCSIKLGPVFFSVASYGNLTRSKVVKMEKVEYLKWVYMSACEGYTDGEVSETVSCYFEWRNEIKATVRAVTTFHFVLYIQQRQPSVSYSNTTSSFVWHLPVVGLFKHALKAQIFDRTIPMANTSREYIYTPMLYTDIYIPTHTDTHMHICIYQI